LVELKSDWEVFMVKKLIFIFIITVSLAVLLSSCFIFDLFQSDTSSEDPVSSEPEVSSESETTLSESYESSISSEPEQIEISEEEIAKIKEYIEKITLYENISNFENIEDIDPNWLAGRFFYMAEYADPEDYDADFNGAYIATLDSVQAVINENVNPDIVLSSEFNFELDESLVVWLPDYKLFSWYGRGLPYGFRVSFPVSAYEINDTIYYDSIDLQEYWDYGEDETEIKDIYNELGDSVVGTYNPVSGEYLFSVDIQSLDVFRYGLVRNGVDGYYLVSKIKLNE